MTSALPRLRTGREHDNNQAMPAPTKAPQVKASRAISKPKPSTTGVPKSRKPLTKNKHLITWVEKMANLTKPAAVHWVDGSESENEALCNAIGGRRDVYQAE